MGLLIWMLLCTCTQKIHMGWSSVFYWNFGLKLSIWNVFSALGRQHTHTHTHTHTPHTHLCGYAFKVRISVWVYIRTINTKRGFMLTPCLAWRYVFWAIHREWDSVLSYSPRFAHTLLPLILALQKSSVCMCVSSKLPRFDGDPNTPHPHTHTMNSNDVFKQEILGKN